jgi:hypothetical protein
MVGKLNGGFMGNTEKKEIVEGAGMALDTIVNASILVSLTEINQKLDRLIAQTDCMNGGHSYEESYRVRDSFASRDQVTKICVVCKKTVTSLSESML